jgi:hypothetical protein
MHSYDLEDQAFRLYHRLRSLHHITAGNEGEHSPKAMRLSHLLTSAYDRFKRRKLKLISAEKTNR